MAAILRERDILNQHGTRTEQENKTSEQNERTREETESSRTPEPLLARDLLSEAIISCEAADWYDANARAGIRILFTCRSGKRLGFAPSCNVYTGKGIY